MMKKTVELGFFLALALILAYVESLIPFSFGIPGIKMGLPNLIVLLILYRNDIDCDNSKHIRIREALLVNTLRIILSGFLFSNMYAILYALTGACFSFASMLLGRRVQCFSIIGVSVLGGVSHNIGQIIVAMLVVETFYVGYYIPFLMIAGTVTGAVLGFVATELRPYLMRYERSGDAGRLG